MGRLISCGCDPTSFKGKTPAKARGTHWKWGGCSHNLDYGMEFSRQFLDSREKAGDIQSTVNLHNNQAGRLVNTNNYIILYIINVVHPREKEKNLSKHIFLSFLKIHHAPPFLISLLRFCQRYNKYIFEYTCIVNFMSVCEIKLRRKKNGICREIKTQPSKKGGTTKERKEKKKRNENCETRVYFSLVHHVPSFLLLSRLNVIKTKPSGRTTQP